MTARDASTSTAQRICPKCGHPNSNISLFCAECGAVLNGAQDDDRNGGAYAAPSQTTGYGSPMSADDDLQETQPIPPAPTTAEQDWAAMMASSRDDDASATAPLPKMTPPTSSVTPPPVPAEPGPVYEPQAWAAQPAPVAPAGTASAPLLANGVSFGLEEEPHHSMRGFWFGVVAIILILAVLGLYGWSILPDGGFRDTVTGWF